MGKTIWFKSTGIYSESAQRHAADHHTHGFVHRHDDVDVYGNRIALREISSLPVLCLSFLGDSLPSLEIEVPSRRYIRAMVPTRMGVERLPQHNRKLTFRCFILGHPSIRCLGER